MMIILVVIFPTFFFFLSLSQKILELRLFLFYKLNFNVYLVLGQYMTSYTVAFLSPDPVTMYLSSAEMSQLRTDDDSFDWKKKEARMLAYADLIIKWKVKLKLSVTIPEILKLHKAFSMHSKDYPFLLIRTIYHKLRTGEIKHTIRANEVGIYQV